MRTGVCLGVMWAAAMTAAAAEPVDFARDVLPILKTRCFECHDGRKQVSGLRLDVRAKAIADGESGAAGLVVGSPDKSEILRRVVTDDPDERMPPDDAKPLAAAEVAVLRRWIAEGAKGPDALSGEGDGRKHWAFVAPKRPAVPAVADARAVRNPIDAFVLARLKSEGLAPSPEADKVTLIRRLHLALTGLPPQVGDVDAFVADPAPDAYEKAVDRLLASPHYAERWARWWLDAARYADSDGFEKDKPRTVWFYRDWVINALNRDLPYDRFLIEQLAGDQLPGATQDQIVATGYLRNSLINEEGGVDPEQFRMEAMFDRMDAVGKGILGLTVQCAQCHNHKYDPVSQAEYYRLFAFLNNDHEAAAAVYTPDQQMRRAEIFRQVRAIEADLRHKHPDWRERMHAWEDAVRGKQPKWTVLRPEVDDISTGGQKYLPQPDGSLLAAGYAPTKHTVKLALRTDLKAVTAIRLELLNDPNLPMNGPGRSVKGTGALTDIRVEAAGRKIKILRATADANPPEAKLEAAFDDRSKKNRRTGPVAFAIDGDNDTAWGIDVGPGRRNVPRNAVFVPEAPIRADGGVALTVFLAQNHGGWNSDDNQTHNLGRIRLSVTDAAEGLEADAVPPAVRAIIEAGRGGRTPAQDEAVFAYWRMTVPEWKDAADRIEALWKTHPEPTSQLVLQGRDRPRTTHVLKRGDFLKPGDAVTAGVPAVLNPLPADAPPTRLGFARWIADRSAPTTARALVNRVWQMHFGTGIVATSEDLGTQCEPPSHPELLDWLAVEFMEQGWSLKKLHRLIVTSAAFRRSSRVSAELAARDPDNRLLARGPRFRMEAEAVRDIALAASGLLNPAVGGPSVYPSLPEFMLKPPVSYGPKVWPESKGPDRYRRALYTFRFRSLPFPMLQTFDAPAGDAACVRRVRSNTPLQALMTLNEPVFVECAQALALRTLGAGGGDDAARMTYAFRRCVSRTPTAEESAELSKLLAAQRERFAKPGAQPWAVAARDPKHPPELPAGCTPADAAAWTVVCRVLLNLDETISLE